jgi:site-specific recombinase XerC
MSTWTGTPAPILGLSRRLPEVVLFYLQWHHIEGHTPATVNHYRKELKQLVEFLHHRGHSLQVDRITAFDILALLQNMKAKGRQLSSIRTRFADIRAFLNWCV